MKQLIQNLSNGKTELIDTPNPQNLPGYLLIKSIKSIISIGTESMLIDFAKSNLINKAKQQPDKVKQVLEKIKTDGIISTIDKVKNKLNQPITLGYSNVGVVLDTNVEGFSKGDRVISNGPHAEVVRVPKNLCAKVPNDVDDDSAVFTVLGAIGLQGVRLLNPTIGETIVVTGLGLIGLLSIQILKANGCRVLGIDYDTNRCEIAKKFGVEVVNLSKGEDPLIISQKLSNGLGIDGALITASTDSDEPIHQAANMCRKRGRIVLIGVAGLNLLRDDFYKKELSFQVSCSYGPGRYDLEYEDKGNDYPFGYVRWTEQRNFDAVLELMSSGKLNIKDLISHRFHFEKSLEAYDLVSSYKSSLGIIIEYNSNKKDTNLNPVISLDTKFDKIKGVPTLGVIGSGNYASSMLLPAFNKHTLNKKIIVSSGGLSSTINGKKFGFSEVSSNPDKILNDNQIDTVVIATRHDSHADLVLKSLESGKHIFVEKPLALTYEELENIQKSVINNSSSILMIGYNRRFSPLILKMKGLINNISSPISMVMTVNSGYVPKDHWIQDISIGGGRIIGELCHFIDLLRYFGDSNISDYKYLFMDSTTNDTVTLQLKFNNGSIGVINYFSNGSKLLPKERLEIFFEGKVLQLDNYKTLKGYGITGFNKIKKYYQDKGQEHCVKEFIEAIKNGLSPPIPYDEIFEVSKITLDIASSK